MSRVCACCRKKISRSEKHLALIYEHEVLCENCCEEAKRLLMPIKILADKKKSKEVRRTFKAELEASAYPDEVKKLLKKEFDEMYWADFFVEKDPVRRIEAGFDQVYSKVVEIMNRYKMEPGEPFVAEWGKIKIAKMSHSEFYENGRGYFITVVIVGDGDRTIVSSSGNEGLYTDENEKNIIFWKCLSRSFEDIEFEEITENPYTIVPLKADESRGTKMRVGILGGSFDPVHLGHVALAESALKEAGLDRVIVMPARIQPFKQGKRVTEDYHREAMARLAFEGNDRIEVSQYELNNTGISYTIKTLTYLRDIYPEEKLFFILGTDSFLSMEEWHRGSEILENFSVIVSSRPGYREAELESKIEEYKEKYGTDIVKLVSKMPSVSSTEVRDRLAAGKNVSGMIPYSVERYIKKNGLYKQNKRIY